VTRRLPARIQIDLANLTPEIPPEVFSDAFRDACHRLDAFVEGLLVELASTLAIPQGEPVTAGELTTARGWAAGGTLAVEWLLENLELFGRAERRADGYVVRSGPPPRDPAEIRAEAVAALPSTRPSFEVMERAAGALPAVLRGEMHGEEALFGPATLSLWFDYFSNANPLYYPNNAIAAVAVAGRAPAGARLLEVGGGGGSCGEAVLVALAAAGKPAAVYCFTELQPAFLRRGARVVRAAAPASCEVVSRVLDINRVPPIEELGGERFDVVLGVNTLHLAADVVATLAALRGLLRPGGALVLGELLRPAGTGAVHLELPFVLLDSYRDVRLSETIRPRPGFLTVDGWRQALRQAGFEEVEVVPRAIDRCVRGYPGFYAGSVVARNPAAS